MPQKPAAKPARKRTGSPRTKAAAAREVEHAEIASRAYFIHLDEGSHDEVANWLRAERELTAA